MGEHPTFIPPTQSDDTIEPGKAEETPAESPERGHFDDFVETFPQDQRGDAYSHIDLRSRINDVAKKDWPLWFEINKSMVTMIAEKEDGSRRKCKLLHLYGGSSLGAGDWKKLPMDTPDGDFQAFADRTRALLEERGF